MTVITFSSPKGGVGKTTTAMILASTLVGMGYKTTIIDADRNAPFIKWRDYTNDTNINLSIVGCGTDDRINQIIKAEEQRCDIIICDLEGIESKSNNTATAMSDLVIIPMSESYLEIDQAARARDMIEEAEDMLQRSILTRILITRSGGIGSKDTIRLNQEIKQSGMNLLETRLSERQAYKIMFSQFVLLQNLQDQHITKKPREKAIEEASQFTTEILKLLEVGK